MTARHPFRALRDKMSPVARNRAAPRTEQLQRAMDLAELRRAFALSQQQLAKKLRMNQPEVAKIEKRADVLLSTLGWGASCHGCRPEDRCSFPRS
jgi:DNA-binding transcriptional regulator YiaG